MILEEPQKNETRQKAIAEGLTPGSQVDQFRIVRKLGQGGMSEVYLARDVTLGRKVALKVIRADSVDSPRRMEQFLQEAHLTAKFSHPHIITIYSVGSFEGHPYLALDYLEGQTLEERMREGVMAVPESIRIALAIAQALVEAHSHGVLHRDLKPANVIIPADGRIRVLDFGISKIMYDSSPKTGSEEESAADSKEVSPFARFAQEGITPETATDEIQGTPPYMAPECWLNEEVTSATDVWALGVILYEMLTQMHPFVGKERSIIAFASRIILTLEPPPLPPILKVPSELAQLITSMLDRNASRRPTGQLVVDVLQGLLQRKETQPLEKGSPFRGLLPFSEHHADFFFGRSTEIEMAVERLRNEPILPVVGPSGAGKSSFVAAGVVPRLRELGRWIVITVRPGTEPFKTLGSAIHSCWKQHTRIGTSPSNSGITNILTEDSAPQTIETGLATLRCKPGSDNQKIQSSNLARTSSSSWDIFRQELVEKPALLLLELQALADETLSKVLLFVDQLEELYTLGHDTEIRRAYIETISRAADDPDGPIRVVFTLREDFLGRVAETPTVREALSRITVLRAPGEQALYEIVTKPVRLAGYSYEDKSLPAEMIDAVRETTASLPILQFACSQFWNRRDSENRLLTRGAYQAMGGVEGALASEADDLLAGLSEVQQDMVRQIVLRLVTPQETRRVVTEQELLEGLDSGAAFLLKRLTASRMVVSRRAVDKEGVEAELELVHDSLIHSWKPLVRWLEQSREEVVFLDEVSRAAELWDSRGRPKAEVWSGRALDEALAKLERCEVVPNRVKAFLEAGELRRQAHARRLRNIRFAVLGTLLAVIAVLTLMIRVTIDQRDRERHAHASSLREGARAAFTKGNFLEARSKLRASIEARDSTQARALWWLLEQESLVWSMSLGGFVNGVSVSPDGQLIAASTGHGYIHIFDAKTLERRVLSGHKGQVRGIEFSPNGRWLSSGAEDRDIRLWDLQEGTVKVLKGHTNQVWSAVFSPDSKRLVSGSRDGTIKVWDIDTGSLLRSLETSSTVNKVSFSADGRFFISVNGDDKVRVWNAQNYELDHVIEEPGLRIHAAATSSDGKLLAYGSYEGLLIVRDLKKQQEAARLHGHKRGVVSVCFSPNDDAVAAASGDGKVRIWDTRSWSLRNQFHHAKRPLSEAVFLPDGERIVSVGEDGTLKLWQLGVESVQKASAGHDSAIYALAFTPDGKTIATGGPDGNLHFWNVASGQSWRRIHAHESTIRSIEIERSGKLLASGAFDGSIRLWEIPHGELRKTLLGHRGMVSGFVFTPDGRQLISSSLDSTISFWDLESLTLNKSLSTEGVVVAIDLDPDGRLLASASWKQIEIRDIETGQTLQTFAGHSANIFEIAFSLDGKSLYSSSYDRTVLRHQLGLNSTQGKVVARHNGSIYVIDVTHFAEEILGTPSVDGTAKLWKVETGDVITLKGHRNEVNVLKFSPDGKSVATVSDDGTLRLWDTKTGQPLWRTPLMLEGPPEIFSQQGWILLDGAPEPTTPTQQWQKALERSGKIASATADRQTLCMITFDDKLQIWNIAEDERMSVSELTGVNQVLAIRDGCLCLADSTLTVTQSSGVQTKLGSEVDAISRFDDSVFVLQAGKVRILDLECNEQQVITATTGASALSIVGDNIALGFPDGRIEIWRKDDSSAKRDFACREGEASAVTKIIPGPPSTIIAGFANGLVGIWSLETGERLYSQRLHGPVIHLLHQDRTLVAATELGSYLHLDLSTFYTDYCELMERVWSSVPWAWREGRARFRERPSDHVCAQNPTLSE